MFKIVWTVFTLTAQGPLLADVPETTRFKNEAECKIFAERVSSRLADWVRGAIRADWSHEVQVTFRCERDASDA